MKFPDAALIFSCEYMIPKKQLWKRLFQRRGDHLIICFQWYVQLDIFPTKLPDQRLKLPVLKCNLNTTFWSAFQNNRLSFEVIMAILWVNKDWDKTLTSQLLPSSSVTVQLPICFTSAVPLIISLTFHLYTNMLVWVDPASSTTPY